MAVLICVILKKNHNRRIIPIDNRNDEAGVQLRQRKEGTTMTTIKVNDDSGQELKTESKESN